MNGAGGTRAWTLFLVAWAAVALITRTAPAVDHEWSRLGTIDSIVERRTFELETSRFHGTGDKIFNNGHYYSHQPPLLPVLQSPVYWILRRFDLRFWNSAAFDLAYYLFTLFTNGLAFALTVVIFDRLLGLAGLVSRWRGLLAFLLPAGTWLLPYALVSNNHGISALLIAQIAWLLLSICTHGATTAPSGDAGNGTGARHRDRGRPADQLRSDRVRVRGRPRRHAPAGSAAAVCAGACRAAGRTCGLQRSADGRPPARRISCRSCSTTRARSSRRRR